MINRRLMLASGLMAGAVAASPLRALARQSTLSLDLKHALDQAVDGKLTVGGALIAVQQGRLIGEYYWGKASLPFDRPVGPNTLFHLGSNGKLVTAVAVMQLLRAGGISLDATIGSLMPDLPPAIGGMRLDRLMSHTSGLPDYGEFFEDWDRPQPKANIIKAVADAPMMFEQGASFSYSNTNYLVLGWLIEHLSGMSYADYVAKRLFEPTGMPTARADASQHVIPNRAEPYEFSPDGEAVHAVRMEDAVSRAADGGILMSAMDVAAWRHALASNRLLAAEDWQRINSPTRLNSGRLIPYGFGTFVDQDKGRPVLHHNGGVPGFMSMWRTWPNSGLSILMMTNSMARFDQSPPFNDMIELMAEACEPGVVQPRPRLGDGTDERTQALLKLISRNREDPPPEGLLAVERTVAPELVPGPLPAIEGLYPMESWMMGNSAEEGEMVRYGLTMRGRPREILVGWTPQNQIYWM
ncbi:serine hydrolase domain-containing protein [uncultured Brevundimonas sp.]|uniref:serine hydrolase domain-containing protein n=1 Tax=uncultured Brevundimonas sp. TaxID=213418 RepID=UPI0026204D03|nr:serine hydrolase domain-containing protein [uncultured Brevundimonas sp.]